MSDDSGFADSKGSEGVGLGRTGITTIGFRRTVEESSCSGRLGTTRGCLRIVDPGPCSVRDFSAVVVDGDDNGGKAPEARRRRW